MTSAAPICRTIFVLTLILSGCFGEDSSESDRSKLTVHIEYEYYEIKGATENELRDQLDQHVGRDARLAEHDAYTKWYVTWRYPTVESEGRYSTDPIAVHVAITQIFPLWNARSDAPPELETQWKSYLSSLKLHEDGHRQIGIDAGDEILRALRELPTYPSPDELERSADKTGESILNEFRQKELTYDHSTLHGATQGARFPGNGDHQLKN